MWIYVPAVSALLIKIAILYFGRGALLQTALSRAFLALLIIMTGSNALELVAYYYGDTLLTTEILLKLYYVSLVCLFALLLQISMLLVNRRLDLLFGVANFALGAIMIGFLLFTDLIITGARSIGYTVTRIPGDFYFLAQAYGIAMIFASVGVCIYGYKAAKYHYAKIQCMYLVVAVFAMCFPIFIAILAMAAGIEITAAVILPIGISFFLLIITYALNSDGIYDIRVWILGTVMFRLHTSLHREFMLFKDGKEMSAKERKERNEKRFLIEALIRTDGNQGQAAKNLSISPSSMSIKRKYYGI